MDSRSAVAQLWDRLSHSSTKQYAAFYIPRARVVSPQSGESVFVANEIYFELRIAQQFLKDKREYFQVFSPLTLVFLEFLYGGSTRSLPFIVGPSLLAGLGSQAPSAGQNVVYSDTRIAGPVPYRGNDVAVFVGLYRIKTKDWALQALKLLESVAKIFDTSKLTRYLDIAEPLVDGIESFLGMGNEMELRLGQRRALREANAQTVNGSTDFVPGYFVLIRNDISNIDPAQFWVREGQLFYGQTAEQSQPYRDNDYVLYNFAAVKLRSDYTSFESHKQWVEVQKQILDGNLTKARADFLTLIKLIKTNQDLIQSQVNQLIIFYRRQYDLELAQHEQLSLPAESLDSLTTGRMNRALERFDRLQVDQVVLRSLQSGLELPHFRLPRRAPARTAAAITEKALQTALKSRALNTPAIKALDTEALVDALNAELLS
jgi:hypothetical protein